MRIALATALVSLLLAQAFSLALKRVAFELQRAELAATVCVNRDIPAATLDCRAACVWEATAAAEAVADVDGGEDGATTPSSSAEERGVYVGSLPVLAKAPPADLPYATETSFGYAGASGIETEGREERPPEVG